MILMAIVILGAITNYIDSARVTTGHEPKCCIKTVSYDGVRVTYWGLGYKVIKYVKNSHQDPYEENIGVKMGSWFMKYELPKQKTIEVEYNGKTIEIINYNEILILENILLHSKYDSELCDGISTYKITLDSEVYYIKESCEEIQKGNKQAKITKEDLNTILEIIKDKNELN